MILRSALILRNGLSLLEGDTLVAAGIYLVNIWS